MSATVSGSDENVSQLVPPFLPFGEVIGWTLNSAPNPVTKRNEYTYSVCVQTVGAFRSAAPPGEKAVVMLNCDGPCGTRFPSNHLLTMGKCDHQLCKACYGLVKNPDGSYGCSNFYCWAEPRESFRSEKAAYRKVINKQIARARKLKKNGEDVKTCNESALPATPLASEHNIMPSTSPSATSSAQKSRKKRRELETTASSSDVDSCGLIKM